MILLSLNNTFNFGEISYGDHYFLNLKNLSQLSVSLTPLNCIQNCVNNIDKFQLKDLSIALFHGVILVFNRSVELDICFENLTLHFINSSIQIKSRELVTILLKLIFHSMIPVHRKLFDVLLKSN